MKALLFAAALSAAAAPQPKPGPWKAYAAPPRARFALANGLKVVYVSDPRAPLLTVRLAARGGTALGGERGAGLVSALAELLTEGTARRSALEAAEAAEAAGGSLAAAVDEDHIVVSAEGLAEKAGPLLALLAETVLEPAFPEAEVALRKENMLSELALRRSQPHKVAEAALRRALYGAHPYAVYGPDEAAIAAVDRAALQRLHKKLFTPQNAVLVGVGALSAEAFRAELEAAFSAWAATPELPSPPPPAPAPPAGRVLAFHERAGSAQSVFALARPALKEGRPGWEALLVAETVLGGSFAARLTSDLREAKGWTYGIYSVLEESLAAASLAVRSQARGEVTRPALDAVLGHLERLRREAPAAAELEQAKALLAGRFVRSLETQEGLAGALLHDALFGLPDDRLDRFVGRVRAVSAEDARKAAEAWMATDRLAIAVVGDAAAAKALEGLAPMTRVDADGKPTPAAPR